MTSSNELLSEIYLLALQDSFLRFDWSKPDTEESAKKLLDDSQAVMGLPNPSLDRCTANLLADVRISRIQFFDKVLQSSSVPPDVRQSIARREVMGYFHRDSLQKPQKQLARYLIYEYVSLRDLLPLIDDQVKEVVFDGILYDLVSDSNIDSAYKLSLRYTLLGRRPHMNFVRIFIEEGSSAQRRKLFATITNLLSAGYLPIPEKDKANFDSYTFFQKYNTLVFDCSHQHLSAILQRELTDGHIEWVLQQLSSLQELNSTILSTPYDPNQPLRISFNKVFSDFAGCFYRSEQNLETIDAITKRLLLIADASSIFIIFRNIIEADGVQLSQKAEALEKYLNQYKPNLPLTQVNRENLSQSSNRPFYQGLLAIIQNNKTDPAFKNRIMDFLRGISTQRFDPHKETEDDMADEICQVVVFRLKNKAESLLVRAAERAHLAKLFSDTTPMLTYLGIDHMDKSCHLVTEAFHHAFTQRQIPWGSHAMLLRQFLDYFFRHADSSADPQKIITDFFTPSPSVQRFS